MNTNSTIMRSLWLLVGTAWAGLSGLPAVADDTELFVASAQSLDARPNILFVIDTSGSMDSIVQTQPAYDPTISYSGNCAVDSVYFRFDTGDPPDCTTNNWFDLAVLHCNAAVDAFNRGTGRYTDRFGQYNNNNSNDRWEAIDSTEKSRPVECEDDAGLHGEFAGDNAVYAQNGNSSQLWSPSSNKSISWGQTPVDRTYTVYEGNYVNWFYGPTTQAMRIDVVKDVAIDTLNSVNGVNVGLMRFNDNEGGPVIYAMEDVATARTPMATIIKGLPADGRTPLSETLYEAGLYYMGRNVDYGNVNDPDTSVAASRDPSNSNAYNSPIEYTCQKNFVVLLTDGAPTEDVSADAKVPALPGFSTAAGTATCDDTGDGRCLDDMAAYLYESDLSPLPGKQNAITYTIGFTVDLPILAKTATRGGGSYYLADDTASLTTVLTSIVTEILESQTTFTAPSVSVNAFNRTQNLNDLYISVFQASGDTHWPGNLKKYRLSGTTGDIVDADGNPAVDLTTGFFDANARSYWSVNPDGGEVVEGGAANRLPAPISRNVYTSLSGSLLTSAGNSVDLANLSIDNALLGIGQPGDPTRDQLIDFMRGVDANDYDQDNDRTEARNSMGDPLHSEPVSVIYGGTAANPDVNDAVVYVATNDGFLHAIDPLTGVEKWAFIPPEFLDDQVLLFRNDSTSDKHYGIDGKLRVQFTADNDGVVDPSAGEKVHLYFGMRRGGNFYYALDVTNPDSPQVMWQLDGSTLPGVGQSWSSPVPTRVNISGAPQNADQNVLIFSGGYDTSQDLAAGGTDNLGNALYVVDSESGALLWHASSANSNLDLADMQYAIPSDVKVLDINTDGFADRIYVGDMGGQVWRFDIHNGQPASGVVTGGVIAQLGSAPNATPTAAETRRFYYAPDLALVGDEYSRFLHVGIGSGHRAHPNSSTTQDRFYALRDYEPFTAFPQAHYDALTPITEADLVDVTNDVNAVVPAGDAGWRFELRDGGWVGEKVLAESRTFNNQVFFTTFTPGAGALSNACQPALGTNRLYVVDLLTGAPVNNLDNSADPDNLTETDRYREFQGSISSEVSFLFPSPDDPVNCVGDQCTPPPLACVGLFCFPPGFGNDPIRTFWSQESTN